MKVPLEITNQLHNDWTINLVEEFFKREQLYKEAVAPTDQSTFILEELSKRGYSEVTWRAGSTMCFVCQDLHGQVWPLGDFLYFTKHDAPIFSKSHVGCKCSLVITGVDQSNQPLPEQIVVAF